MRFSGTPKGFTLVELMVILMLIAIMAMVALPSFNELIDKSRTQTANNELVSLLQYARAFAVEHRTAARVCVDEDGVITVKRNCDDDEVLRRLALAAGVTIAADEDEIMFRYNGTVEEEAVFKTCHDGDFANGFTVTVMPTGSVRTFARGKKDATTTMSECSES